ncbi:MAG: dTMP kinase [Candidatus Dormibacteraeota bacterium]|nr:dTMP kinase [Candidatus Dormibacteraeota bacterium]
MLVTLEGPDGGGKSTQLALLARRLGDRQPLLVREPGSTPLGESLRELLLDRRRDMGAEAEMHLFMAARSELLRLQIRPALAAGRLVICDRYHDSTMVYQRLRGAPVYWPATFPIPDLTVLLQVTPDVARVRRARAGAEPDRLEAQAPEFHQAVADAYRALADADPARWLVIEDGRGAPEIAETVAARIESRPVVAR